MVNKTINISGAEIQAAEFYAEGLKTLVSQYQKCLELNDNNVKK